MKTKIATRFSHLTHVGLSEQFVVMFLVLKAEKEETENKLKGKYEYEVEEYPASPVSLQFKVVCKNIEDAATMSKLINF